MPSLSTENYFYCEKSCWCCHRFDCPFFEDRDSCLRVAFEDRDSCLKVAFEDRDRYLRDAFQNRDRYLKVVSRGGVGLLDAPPATH